MELPNLLRYVRFLKPGHDSPPSANRLPYSKACNRGDFDNPQLRSLMREIFAHERRRLSDAFPTGREDRLYWRTAMMARSLADFGVLRPRAEVLAVGAGNEPILFWLTTRVGCVYAADLYLNRASTTGQRSGSMAVEPDRHWPGPWDPRRLVVQHMPPYDLRYSDEAFDAVVVPHALAECTSEARVEQTLEELVRVVKPGGMVCLVVEMAVEGPASSVLGRLFGEQAIQQRIVAAQPWTAVGGLSLEVADATRRSEQPVEQVTADLRRHLDCHGQLLWHKHAWSRYPHLAIRDEQTVSVPVHLALRRTMRQR
jgi:SAM-dependent methyltransferase